MRQRIRNTRWTILRSCLLMLVMLGSISVVCATETASGIQKIKIPVWGGVAPGSEELKGMLGLPSEYVTPRLTVLLPPVSKRVGSFVLIVPGGGYMYCSAGREGFEVADWFLERGIAAGVVQYRRNIFRKGKEFNRVYNDNVAFADVARSMRIVRSNAAKWGIQTNKIGVIGFSAGGHVAATMAVHPKKGDTNASDTLGKYPTRPDFMILAYPLISMAPPWGGATWRNNLLGKNFDPKMADYFSCQKHVTPQTPPGFIVCAGDDFTLRDSLAMFKALKAEKVPCELHVFEKGKHGYGMTSPGLTITKCWPQLLEAWLKEHDVIPVLKLESETKK